MWKSGGRDGRDTHMDDAHTYVSIYIYTHVCLCEQKEGHVWSHQQRLLKIHAWTIGRKVLFIYMDVYIHGRV